MAALYIWKEQLGKSTIEALYKLGPGYKVHLNKNVLSICHIIIVERFDFPILLASFIHPYIYLFI